MSVLVPPPSLWDRIDLDSHAVIEASAGTGKTFTVERLVARILRDVPGTTIDRLLLLTYTDKATGELRERIRGHLAEQIQACEGASAQRLRDAVESFDTAQIFTIHGFCQRVLQEYAFENRQVFDLELSGDKTILKRLFREQLRTSWRREHLPGLPRETAVRLAGDGFMEEVILGLVGRLQPDDVLRPEIPESPAVVVAELAAAVERLRALVGDGHAFLEGYWRLDLAKANGYSGLTRKSVEPVWQGLWSLLVPAVDAESLGRFVAWHDGIPYSRIQKGDGDLWRGFRVLVPPALRLADATVAAAPECPALGAVVGVLEDELVPAVRRAKLLVAGADIGVVQASVRALQEAYAAYKQEHGLIDFDDMLVRVRDALTADPERARILLAALRAKYWFALVDEFQDTDPIQWEIFRRIFVEHDGGPQRLFLVGDPKQAIYGFRGADVNTYLQARDALVERFGFRVLHSLDTNFRSIPALLDGLNRIFARPEWFGDGPIAYSPVACPDETNRNVRVLRDGTRRSPLCLVHVNRPGEAGDNLNKGRALWRFARFVAEEIARLLAAPDEFQFVLAGSDQPLRRVAAGDICVLVQRRADARPVETGLRELGIPYTFYKKPGIYQSAEALHTSLMLGALASPDAARSLHPALLSRFFARTPQELAQDPVAVEQETRGHFERWRELCRERRWSALFRSLLEDTGLLYREALAADGDRRLANYRQLFQELAALAETQSLDVAGLREQFDLRRRRSVAVEGDEDLHHIDTERPKVTIMTMHASKGLQFPIVFVVGGFSAPDQIPSLAKHITYHDGPRRVVELKAGDGFVGKARAQRERADEVARLFYVALTRAQFKVYLPFGWNPATERKAPQPITPLLTPCLDPFWERGDEPQNDAIACHLDTLGGIVGTGYPSPPFDTMEGTPPREAVSPPPADELAAALADLRPVPSLGRWRRQLDSYSSLARGHGGAPSGVRYGERDAEETADDWDGLRPADEELVPPGAAAGTALHEILEQADFSRVLSHADPAALLCGEPAFAGLVRGAMTRNGLAELARRDSRGAVVAATSIELARMVHRALTTPLAADGFRLGELSPADRQTELEFHLSEGEDVLGLDPAVPAERRGLLKGFIDLVYRRNGRYYVVDWKTNALSGGYAPDRLRASMDEHEYTLQFRIYALALSLWLRQCLPDFSPERHLGGVYYLYVRGLNGVDAASGVFHQPLDAAFLDLCRRDVLDRLAGR